MECPRCDIELSCARKTVEFIDDKGNSIEINCEAQWCSDCGYIDCVS